MHRKVIGVVDFLVAFCLIIQRGRLFMGKDEISELISGILNALGDSVVSIILYGSVAKGTNDLDSDVDIAVILSDKLEKEEYDALTDFIVDLDLKYDRFYSVVDIKESDFLSWKEYIPFYKNVSREGVVLWKAA